MFARELPSLPENCAHSRLLYFAALVVGIRSTIKIRLAPAIRSTPCGKIVNGVSLTPASPHARRHSSFRILHLWDGRTRPPAELLKTEPRFYFRRFTFFPRRDTSEICPLSSRGPFLGNRPEQNTVSKLLIGGLELSRRSCCAAHANLACGLRGSILNFEPCIVCRQPS